MAVVTFVSHDGEKDEALLEEGLSLMQIATNNAVPGIDGDCGGEAACGTCHVIVDPQWSEMVGRSSAVEEEMLAMKFVDGSDVPAQMKAVGLTAEGLAERRMIMLNTWRNTSDEPVGRCPLAVADQRTIKSGDGCGGVVGRVGLARRAGQQLYYFPGLTREELLVFIGYDSDAKEHAPCVHSAFDDMNAPADAPPRQSIELRCVLVMPPASYPAVL